MTSMWKSALAVLNICALGGPQESPPDQGVIGTSQAGYTLLAPLRQLTTYLIDMQGEVVHRWKSTLRPGMAVYLLKDGSLLRACRIPREEPGQRGSGGRLQRIAWDGTLLWEYTCADPTLLQHHDVEPLPNGNVLLIAWERMDAHQVVALGRDPRWIGGQGFWSEVIREVRPVSPNAGEVVWEWRALDHVIQDFDSELPNWGEVAAHPELIDLHADLQPTGGLQVETPAMPQRDAQGRELRRGSSNRKPGDWLHINSVHYLAQHDLILLSSRRLNEIWVIDHSTTTEQARGHAAGRFGQGGDLLYRFGNPQNYRRGTSADQVFFGQHDARWVLGPQGRLEITVFNNGAGRPGNDTWSSVDTLVLPFDPNSGFASPTSGSFGPSRLRRRIGGPGGGLHFFSGILAGAQHLPDGNTLICSGAESRLIEVTPEGEVVWEYQNRLGTGPAADPIPDPVSARRMAPGALFRATRIAHDHPGLSRLH